MIHVFYWSNEACTCYWETIYAKEMHVFFFYLENIINTEFTLRIEDFNNRFAPMWLETGPCMTEYTM